MARLHAARLLVHGVRTRDRVLLDLAIDLLIPPLATIVALTAVGLGAWLAFSLWAGHLVSGGWLWVGCALGLTVYGLRGWQLSGTGARGLVSLAFVPTYLVWKLMLALRRSTPASGEWVRTAREGREAP